MAFTNNPAFKDSQNIGGFNLVTKSSNFSSVFDPRPLEGEDASSIESLLMTGFIPDSISEKDFEKNIADLKEITAEIRAIGRQSVILMGERVYRAGELLKPYKDGTFTKWLEVAFGSRKTGYNALSYYNFFKELPDEDLKEKFKKMPQKSAYILASRKGADIETKAEIVREYHNLDHDEFVCLIQKKIPNDSKDKRSSKNPEEKLIASIRLAVDKLKGFREYLNQKEKKDLAEIANDISFLLGKRL